MLLRVFAPVAIGLALASFVTSVNLTIPTLAQCESATFQIAAIGNVTIGAKDATRMSNVMRAFVPVMGTVDWTWDKVELPVNETAIFLVTDFFGSSPFDIAQHFATAVVGPSPTNDTSCLPPRFTRHTPDDLPPQHTKSVEIPIIVGVLTGFLGLLLGLVVLVMVRRRRERRAAEKGQDGAGDPQDEARRLVPPDYTPAGGGYMAKLVPGLQISTPQPAEPPSTGTRSRSSRRRNFRTWRRTEEDGGDGDLPSYGESQTHSRSVPPGYSGSTGQAFELRERVPPLRLQNMPVTPAIEVNEDDDGDGWGGRNSIFGSVGPQRSTQGGTSVGGGSSFGGSRSVGDEDGDRIEMLHQDGDGLDEPVTSPLLPHGNEAAPFGR